MPRYQDDVIFKTPLGMKIVLTILLGVIAFLLFGHAPQQEPSMPEVYVDTPVTTMGETDAAYLHQLYDTYNAVYFHDRLPKNIKIDLSEHTKRMASSFCHDDAGTNCEISYNERYTLAPRVADFTMLHEMCHIKVWSTDRDFFGVQIDHGRLWRSCMLQIDMQGGFRQIIIDNYFEGPR
jgi:hypothetical protein